MLFDVKHATVSEHISNILASGELDETSVGFSDKSTGGRKPKIYNSDIPFHIHRKRPSNIPHRKDYYGQLKEARLS